MRVGSGFDVHAFGPGDFVMLGGVRIPHSRGVIAHSDGDVLLHALCDALLGAGIPSDRLYEDHASGKRDLEDAVRQIQAIHVG